MTLSYSDSSGQTSSSTASYFTGTNFLTQPSYIAVGNYSAAPAGSNGAAYGYDGGQLFAIPAPDLDEFSGTIYVMNNRHQLSEVDTASLEYQAEQEEKTKTQIEANAGREQIFWINPGIRPFVVVA